jgi:hypothetical protein
MGQSMLDVGADNRTDAVASVRMLLDILNRRALAADIKIHVLTTAEPFGEETPYQGQLDSLLVEFQNTEMLGFRILFSEGWISVVMPSLYYENKLPYIRIVGESDNDWNESLLDELMKYSGTHYAVISLEETLDLEELDHVYNANFPWGHWRLVVARVRDTLPSN